MDWNVDDKKKPRDDIWKSLNFGLTLWMILGTIPLFFAILSGMYISYRYVCYTTIVLLILKTALTFKTEEYFSLQYLVQ